MREIMQLCTDNGIQIIDFKMVDIDGRWRHLSIPVERFTQDTLTYGIGFDGSNYGYAPVEKSDMVFIPDLDSAHIEPFTTIPTLTMMGNVCVIGEKENKRFDQYPRNVALSAVDFLREQNIADDMFIAPEFEFHIFDNVSYETRPQSVGYTVNAYQATWNSGEKDEYNNGYQLPLKGGYHCSLPHDVNFDLRSQMCNVMKDWGVEVKYHHHEVGGPGQQEIEVELGNLVKMADNTMIIKYVIKNLAIANGKTATFLPKPIAGEAGNGMHVHMLLKKGGKSIFYDPNGYAGLSETAMYFMGGILKHCASLCAFTNPSTNSFKRLVPGYEAPVTVGYATSNRSAVIRIPAYAKSPESKRYELRNPDATCNPYYAYAAILMAGIDGVRNKIDPSKHGWGPFDFNLFNLSEDEKKKVQGLPTSLPEALEALEKDNEYLRQGGVFPQRLIDTWIKRRKADANKVNSVPHPAEFALYYDL